MPSQKIMKCTVLCKQHKNLYRGPVKALFIGPKIPGGAPVETGAVYSQWVVLHNRAETKGPYNETNSVYPGYLNLTNHTTSSLNSSYQLGESTQDFPI